MKPISSTVSLSIGGQSVKVESISIDLPQQEPAPPMPDLSQSITVTGEVRTTLVLGALATFDQN